jgi:hypothetical protein
MSSPIFDPGLPADGSLVDAGELRGQFVALEDQTTALSDRMAVQEARGIGIDPLSAPITNPPTQAQVQAVVDKINEMIASLNP